MSNYMRIVCNFLNNTKGEISKEELAFLVAFRLGLRTYDVLRFITDRDVKIVSLDVDCDNESGFYETINMISDRVFIDIRRECDYYD